MTVPSFTATTTMAAASGRFESARSIEERKEQTRLARAEVLRQVTPFGGFWNHLESWQCRFPGSWASGSASSPPLSSVTISVSHFTGVGRGPPLGSLQIFEYLSSSILWQTPFAPFLFRKTCLFAECLYLLHNAILTFLSSGLRAFEGLRHEYLVSLVLTSAVCETKIFVFRTTT